jgi:hypothetical protein
MSLFKKDDLYYSKQAKCIGCRTIRDSFDGNLCNLCGSTISLYLRNENNLSLNNSRVFEPYKRARSFDCDYCRTDSCYCYTDGVIELCKKCGCFVAYHFEY